VPGNKLAALGGGIILFLLPSLIFSYSAKGLSLSYSVSDNLYLFDAKESGSIVTLSPFLEYSQLFDVEWSGNFYIINFNTDNLFLENDLSIHKHLYLAGAGNKNSAYLRLYNLFTPSFDLYRYTTVSAGDSVNFYLLNRFLFAPEIRLQYRTFGTDSMPDYLEPYAKSALSIPLPYFFLIPGAGLGVKLYENETLPFHRIFTRFSFPLSMNLSLEASVMYYHCASSDGAPPIALPMIDEPFYEEESLEELTSATLVMKKLFQRNRIAIDIRCHAFNKHFFPVEALTRTDSGASIHLLLTKMIDPRSSISVSFESLLNSSTFDDFDYTRNSIGIQFNLLY
jgi:hypothetical protein